jgi:hypothetical protein
VNCFEEAVTFKLVGSNQASATKVSSPPRYAPRLDAKRGDSFLQADFTGLMPDNFRLATIRDLAVLNSVSATASVCHQHASHVSLSTHSVIEKLSGAS